MPSNGKLRALSELLRPANVVTALADVLAGYAAAGAVSTGLPLSLAPHSGVLAWLLASTACLYAGGIVLNDYFDRHLDAEERPERPIPSGRIAASAAASLGFALLIAGITFARAAGPVPAIMACAVSAVVLLYDAWGKHWKFAGPFNMGACRALNLLLGVSAVPAALATRWQLALLPLIYIAGVTALSRGEVRGGKRAVAAMSLAALGLVLAGLLAIGMYSITALVVTAVLAWRVLPPFLSAWRDPAPARIRTAVRAGVLSLVLLDAAIGASYSNVLYCLIILGIAVLAALLARAFAVT